MAEVSGELLIYVLHLHIAQEMLLQVHIIASFSHIYQRGWYMDLDRILGNIHLVSIRIF